MAGGDGVKEVAEVGWRKGGGVQGGVGRMG